MLTTQNLDNKQDNSQNHNKLLVRRLYEECFNTGNLNLLEELLAENFTGSQGEKGAAGFGAVIAGLRRGFPDAHFTLEDMFAEGDRVAVRCFLTATHKGSFAGVAASQKTVAQAAIAIYRIADGKIRQAWLQADRLGLRQQIGGAPV